MYGRSSAERVSVKQLSTYLTARFVWKAALAVFSAVIVLSVLVLQAAHIADKYQIDYASGVWMSLSKSAASGLFYPPLFDGTHYGGTRYMPVPILLPAGLYKVAGSLVVSEKVLLYLFALLTFSLVFVILRRAGCPTLASLALISGVLATRTGMQAALAIRWDTPALAFQLAALALVDRRRDTRALVAAGVLCSLAVASKLSAVWAPAAIVAWLAIYERRKLWAFVPGLAISLLAVLGAFELASGGRMSSNVLGVSFSAFEHKQGIGEVPAGFHTAVFFLKLDLPGAAGVALFLAPFVAVAIGYGLARRRLTLYQLALAVAAVVIFFAYFDPGVSYNHLIDVAVLAAIVVGGLWGELRAGPRSLTWLGVLVGSAAFVGVWLDPRGWSLVAELIGLTALVAACLWWSLRAGSREFGWLGVAVTVVVLVSGATFYRGQFFLPEVKVAVRTLLGQGDRRYTTHPLAGYVSADETMLSEDPSIPVLLGLRPVVLDPFAFDRLIRVHAVWSRKLADRVAAQEFDKLILQFPIERRNKIHFGPEIGVQIEKNYTLAEMVKTPSSGDFWIYVRARRP